MPARDARCCAGDLPQYSLLTLAVRVLYYRLPMTTPAQTPEQNDATLSALREKERELEAQLAATRTERAAAERAQVQALVIALLTIEKIADGKVYVRAASFRNDIVEIFRSTPSRFYDRLTNQNVIAVEYWQACEERLKALPGVQFVHSNGTELELATLLN